MSWFSRPKQSVGPTADFRLVKTDGCAHCGKPLPELYLTGPVNSDPKLHLARYCSHKCYDAVLKNPSQGTRLPSPQPTRLSRDDEALMQGKSSGGMYFETGRCAHCGQYLPHQKHVQFPFCSSTCHDSAIKPFLPKDFTDNIDSEPEEVELRRQVQETGPKGWVEEGLHLKTGKSYYEAIDALNRKVHGATQRNLQRNIDVRHAAEQQYADKWQAQRDYILQREKAKLHEAQTEQLRKEAAKEAERLQKEAEHLQKEQAKEAERIAAAQAFDDLIKARPIPERIRYEHTHILGGSGAGKTTLIQQLVLDDLATDNPPAMVIIDPKGFMAERISKLAVFDPNSGRLRDRLIILDPTKEPLPALNLFHVPDGLGAQRVRNKLIEFFEYIFSTSDADITQRQSIPFRFVVRLVVSMNGDINTLMDVLEDKATALQQSTFAPQILELSKTDDGARRFFSNDFFSSGFRSTREQIRTRLYQIISSPHLMKMFAAPQCRVNFIECLQNRKIILINTGMNDFERKDSQLIGRYAISMTLGAAFARGSIPKAQWNPAYLFIDEFQEFADEQKTPELLRLAREYHLGVVLAHQNMYCDELNDSLRTTISTNTSIKYAAAVEAQDIGYMARDLRCEPDFMRSHKVTDTHVNFACFVRNFLDHPMSISVRRGNIQDSDDNHMPDAAYQQLLTNNAARLAARSKPHVPTSSPRIAPPVHVAVSEKQQSQQTWPASDAPESDSTW